jgi:hypothetical protein
MVPANKKQSVWGLAKKYEIYYDYKIIGMLVVLRPWFG